MELNMDLGDSGGLINPIMKELLMKELKQGMESTDGLMELNMKELFRMG